MTDQAVARELAGVREVLLRLERRLDAIEAIRSLIARPPPRS